MDIDIEKLELKKEEISNLKKEMSNLFVDFLVENGSYSNYFKEVHEQNGTEIDKIIEDIYREKDLGSIITKTLIWDETEQGDKYWMELHREWKNYFTRVFFPLSSVFSPLPF